MAESNNKLFYGCMMVVVLAILLVIGWYLGQDGLLTAAIIGIITSLIGVLFGIEYAIKRKD